MHIAQAVSLLLYLCGKFRFHGDKKLLKLYLTYPEGILVGQDT
jgi:hypothetical protein